MEILTIAIRVGITAGESSNPQKAVPIAIRQVFWRILVFYIGRVSPSLEFIRD
jgi:amino acid permease